MHTDPTSRAEFGQPKRCRNLQPGILITVSEMWGTGRGSVWITEATVKIHVKTVLRKIRVKNRAQAGIWALHSQILPNALDTGNGRIPSHPDQLELRKVQPSEARPKSR